MNLILYYSYSYYQD